MPVISLKGVSKHYTVYPNRQSRLKELLSFGKLKSSHEFWALKNVDLEVKPGTSLGILGRNGAGKSTLLKVISGVLQPTRGEVDVRGRLSALLQLGAGFNPEFTGRENAMINGLIMGLGYREMLGRFDDIEEFADLGQFMNQPVKTYSSGMRARLGFAVAVNVEPEVLLVDETLSVGDEVFRNLGMQKMRDLQQSGATILFVSHGLGMIKSFCDEALLLHKGEVMCQGKTSETLDQYQALLSGSNIQQPEEGEQETPKFKEDSELEFRRRRSFRHGTGEARVENVELLDENQNPTDVVASEATLTVRVHVKYMQDVKNGILSIALRDRNGLDIFSTNTLKEGTPLGVHAAGERTIIDFKFKVSLKQGPYSVNVTVFHPQRPVVYMDWIDVATSFEITQPVNGLGVPGLVHLPTEVQIHEPNAAP